jgi:hypothetical protein
MPSPLPFAIRTITAFAEIDGPGDRALNDALAFLPRARDRMTAAGFEVQTLRLGLRLKDVRPDPSWLDRAAAIDAQVAEAGALWTAGPEPAAAAPDAFPAWAVRALSRTTALFLSVEVAPPSPSAASALASSAARTIERLAAETDGGLGNFRFAAAARCPAGIPFFPVARHEGVPAFAIGLESAGLVGSVYASRPADPTAALRAVLAAALAPVERAARHVARETGRAFLGLDTSAAPGLRASIGGAIESLVGAPFGSAGTLAACAATTAALQSVEIVRCGYSGLMLPVLEDSVLAARCTEGRFGVRELLLYSTVCGIGLDVVPLAGATTVDALTRLLTDVGALAAKLSKPLSARLLPVPGARPGDRSRFENPWLVNSAVLAVE